jgi:hypothetical protein
LKVKGFLGGAVMACVGAFANFVFAAENRVDVSQIIDKALAESVLGEAVKVLTPVNVDGPDGYYSKCNYYSVKPGKRLVLRVHITGPSASQQELEMVKASTGMTKPVRGLGDKAEFSYGDDSNLPLHTVMLYVTKGNAFVTVGLGGLDDDTMALEKAENIAQKILEHL